MTDVLTVPTHFGDISELSTGLADRVDEERLILYGPTAYEEGATVGFAVLLVDGSPALEGVGRVTAAVDGGEERAPETRFDIVFDSLQLEGMSEVVYERIVMARQSMVGGEPATGEVDVSELEDAAAAEAVEGEPVEAAEQPVADWEDDAATAVADPEQMAALADEAAGVEGAEDAPGFDDGSATVVADVSELDGAVAADVELDVGVAMGDVSADAGDAADVADAGDAAVDVSADVIDVAADADDVAVDASADVVDVADAGDVAVDASADVSAVDLDDVSAVDLDDVSAVDLGDVSAVDLGDDDAGLSEVSAADADLDLGDVSDLGDEPDSEAPLAAGDSLGPPPEDPPVAPSPELPPAPTGFQIPAAEGRLVRPTFPPTWQPMAEPPAPSQESTGFFLYEANTLPVPETPPRPDLDPSLRVQPAPRPDEGLEAGANQPSPDAEPQGESTEEPPQVPLPDEDADVAPAVEPESFALGDDDVAIQDPDDAAPAEAADGSALDDEPPPPPPEAMDDEPPPPPPEAMDDDVSMAAEGAGPTDDAVGDADASAADASAAGDDSFDGEIPVEGGLDEDIVFEEDDRV